MLDREYASALLGGDIGESPYALDDRAKAIRDRIRPELADAIVYTRGAISHHVTPPSLLPLIVRRHRLRADGVVEEVNQQLPEREGIARMSRNLRG